MTTNYLGVITQQEIFLQQKKQVQNAYLRTTLALDIIIHIKKHKYIHDKSHMYPVTIKVPWTS
jgi:hypothetical protein